MEETSRLSVLVNFMQIVQNCLYHKMDMIIHLLKW